jgi:hypothetical protein
MREDRLPISTFRFHQLRRGFGHRQ